MSHRPFRLVVIAAAVLAALLAPVPSGREPRSSDGHHPPARTVDVQLLAINDFHGKLLPPAGSAGLVGPCRPAAPSTWPRHIRQLEPQPEHARRVRRRPDRRQPAAVRALPRRADHRGDEPDRPGLNAVGNHEFDEGADRAAAHAERRLPPGRRVPRRRRLPGRRLPVPRRQRRRRGHRQDAVPAVSRSRTSTALKVGLHRHDPGGHADHRHRRRRRRPGLPDEVDTVNALVRGCAASASRRSSC